MEITRETLTKVLQLHIGCMDIRTLVMLHNQIYIEKLVIVNGEIVKEKDLPIDAAL